MKRAYFFRTAILLFAVMVISGCTSNGPNNNYLRPVDFVRHLHNCGIKVDAVRPLDPRPIAAGEALEIAIGNSNIGVYKFDINHPQQLGRLERIRESKRIYFNGIPYPIYEVSGSFIIVGLDKHSEKHRILEALRKFK